MTDCSRILNVIGARGGNCAWEKRALLPGVWPRNRMKLPDNS